MSGGMSCSFLWILTKQKPLETCFSCQGSVKDMNPPNTAISTGTGTGRRLLAGHQIPGKLSTTDLAALTHPTLAYSSMIGYIYPYEDDHRDIRLIIRRGKETWGKGRDND